MNQINAGALPVLDGSVLLSIQHSALVSRARTARIFTLFAAPGSGKTTLLAVYAQPLLNDISSVVSYVEAQDYENSPEGFWRAFLQMTPGDSIAQEVGDPERMLDRFLEKALQSGSSRYCMMDDVHRLPDDFDFSILQRLLDEAPPNVHVVLSGVYNPGLSLSRLRLTSRVVEAGTKDLLLPMSDSMKLIRSRCPQIEEQDALRIYTRANGWIAGMLIETAYIADVGKLESSDFDLNCNPWIDDFLEAEILSLLSNEAMQLAFKTCWFKEVSTVLLEGICDDCMSSRFIQRFMQAGLLHPSRNPNERQKQVTWYEWSEIFVLCLRERAQAMIPMSEIRALVRRGAGWLMDHGYTLQAITAAERNNDYALALEILARDPNEVLSVARGKSLTDLLSRMPYPKGQHEYLYCILSAWASFMNGKKRSTKIWIDRALILEEDPAFDASGTNGDLLIVRKTISISLMVFNGDYEDAVEKGLKLVESLPAQLLYLKSTLLHNVGEALERLGEYERALEVLTRSRSIAELSGRVVIEQLCTAELMWLLFIQGKLDLASGLGLRALRSPTALKDSWSYGLLQVAMARIYLQWGELEKVGEYVESASKSIDKNRNRDYYVECQVTRARREAYLGNNEEASDILLECYEVTRIDKVPRGVNLLALISVVDFLQSTGQWERSAEILEETYAAMSDTDYFYRVHADIVCARLLIHERKLGDASDLLEGAIGIAQSCGMEILKEDCMIWLACVREEKGDHATAISLITQALTDCAVEGRVYPFRYMTPALRALLRAVAYPSNANRVLEERFSKAANFAKKILGMNDETEVVVPQEDVSKLLSQREVEVHDLLLRGCTRAEIAQELDISVNTVRTHVKNIYRKLGIHDRNQL